MTAFAMVLKMYLDDSTITKEVCDKMKHGEADLNDAFTIMVRCAEQGQCEMDD